MATVIIPTPLRKFTNNTSKVNVEAGTVSAAIEQVATEFPDIRKHLVDEKGRVRNFVNVFVGDDDIRDLKQEETKVSSHTIISIVPAIAGGMR